MNYKTWLFKITHYPSMKVLMEDSKMFHTTTPKEEVEKYISMEWQGHQFYCPGVSYTIEVREK